MSVGVTVFEEDELTFLDAVSADGMACAHADISALPLLGLSTQMPLTPSGLASFGIEAGIAGGWASDSSRVAADNAQGMVTIDVDWRVIDLSCGVFLEMAAGQLARVQAGIGPTLLLGRLHRDALEGEINAFTIEDRRSEAILGYAVYGRAGIEFSVDGGWLGIGARGLYGEMGFDGVTDDVDIRACQGTLTYTRQW